MTDHPAPERLRKDAVRIGAASASFVDSRIALPQLLGCGEPLDYIVFDCLAEGVMSILGHARLAGQPAYVTDFVEGQMTPHLSAIAAKGSKIIANAGGLDPKGCAEALQRAVANAGLTLNVTSISGDDLSERATELIEPGTVDMFDGSDLHAKIRAGDQLVSLTAYTGAFSIAQALAKGADIVVTGRVVDSATVLGALIHEFGWTRDDWDLLSAGTLAGHLIECTTQVTGATFTDWELVPDWANIGFPIATCRSDGRVEITKPRGTGGIVSRGTVSEQMLYEVSDPAAYIVPDVVCDWTSVRIEEVGPNRVSVAGARGRGRPDKLKAALSRDAGWRATALAPIVGIDAPAKARRTAMELFKRCAALLDERGWEAFDATHHDVVGNEGRTICRMVADHPRQAGAALFAREQSSIMTSMSVGTSVPLGTTIRPLTYFASFLISRDEVRLRLGSSDGEEISDTAIITPTTQVPKPSSQPAKMTELAADTVPLIALAWARSGDKGNLFNIGVIARKAEYLPAIFSALTPDAVAVYLAEKIGGCARALKVERYAVPGIGALNLVAADALSGGMLANPAFDPAAKGMAQLLLDFPVPVSKRLARSITED